MVIKLTEKELLNIVKRVIKERVIEKEGEMFDDAYTSGEDDNHDNKEEEIIDYDSEENEDDWENMQKHDRLKSSQKNKNAANIQYGRMEWRKEYEKPWSPIKSSDMSLEKYLTSKKQKRDENK
jgi:hypothetical protein